MSDQGIPTIDLFAGAGGLGIGAARAGADIRLSVDSDHLSCETLRANGGLGEEVLEADVSRLSGEELRSLAGLSRSDSLLIVGGPPCQPFSKAAYWTDEGKEARYRRDRAAGLKAVRPEPPSDARPDSRRTLVEEYWRLIVEAEADAFLFENVRSITHPRNRPVLEALQAAALAEGYETTLAIVNAVDYGVPQRRQRVFLMGSRGAAPIIPPRTHADPRRGEGLRPWATVGPTIKPFRSRRYAEPEETVEGRWAAHLRTVPPGGNYKAHTAWGGHPEPTFVTETRFWNFLLKLSPDLPSWTINASPGPWTGPFHWDSRRLRTAELAALQTFPAGYRFEGSKRERVRQIGNAVPVDLGSIFVGAILASLEGAGAGRELEQLAA
jgi:DNA (cytosine-5)-methyltransferase 1